MISNPKRCPIEMVDKSWSAGGVLFVDHTLNKYCVREVPNPGLEIAETFAKRYRNMGAGFRCVVLCVDGEKAHKPAVRDQRDARTMSATAKFVHDNAAAIDTRLFDGFTAAGVPRTASQGTKPEPDLEPAAVDSDDDYEALFCGGEEGEENYDRNTEEVDFDESKGTLFCLVVGSERGNPGRMSKVSDPDHPLVKHIRESLESSAAIVEADHLMFYVARHLADLGTRCVISSRDSDVFGSLLVLAHENISVRYQTYRYGQKKSPVELSVDMVRLKTDGETVRDASKHYDSPWKMLLDYAEPNPVLDRLLKHAEQVMGDQEIDIYQLIRLCVRHGVRGVLAHRLVVKMTYMTRAAVGELLRSLESRPSAARAVAKLFGESIRNKVTGLMKMYRLWVPYKHFYQRCLSLSGKNHVDVTCRPELPDRDLWLFTALVSGTDYTKNIPNVGKMKLSKCLTQPTWKTLAVEFVKLDTVTEEKGIDIYNAIRVIADPGSAKTRSKPSRTAGTSGSVRSVRKISMVRNMLYVLRLWGLQKPVITAGEYGYELNGRGGVRCVEE